MHFVLSLLYEIILIVCILLFLDDKEENYGTIFDKISIGLMAESVIISFNEFEYKIKSWFFFTNTVKVSIAPNMLTVIISILFFSSIMVRNRITLNKDKPIDLIIKDLIMLILGILFFASLISVLVSNEYFYIPIIGETNYTAQSLCIILLAFSWVGIKCISIIAIPIIAFLSVGRIGEVNRAMGIVGIFYLLFAYIAIYLVFKNEKVSEKFEAILEDFEIEFFGDKEKNNKKNDIDYHMV